MNHQWPEALAVFGLVNDINLAGYYTYIMFISFYIYNIIYIYIQYIYIYILYRRT